MQDEDYGVAGLLYSTAVLLFGVIALSIVAWVLEGPKVADTLFMVGGASVMGLQCIRLTLYIGTRGARHD